MYNKSKDTHNYIVINAWGYQYDIKCPSMKSIYGNAHDGSNSLTNSLSSIISVFNNIEYCIGLKTTIMKRILWKEGRKKIYLILQLKGDMRLAIIWEEPLIK